MLNYQFETIDYVVFCSTILISISIGIYHAFWGLRQTTTDTYLMANRQMGFLPVSMSLLVTIMSAVTVLGVPATIYQYGTSYWGFAFSYFIFIPILAHLIMPILYDMRLTSAYEYLELRFSRTVRLCGTTCYVLMMVVYMGVVIYAPALALNAVTGLNLWILIVSLCLSCAFYTTMGGMRAVIWTDVFQAIIMLVAQILVLAIGVSKLGGIKRVFEIAIENDKISPINFDPSPFVPHTFWSVTFGGTFLCLNIFGTNQSAVQRFLCCRSKKDAVKMIYLNFPLLQFVMVLGCVLGVVIFAEFRCNNPLANGTKPDQLLIYYVMYVLRSSYGLSGLFIGCLFSASLSTISSSFNSLATVTLQDFIRPTIQISDKKATVYAKVLVVIYSILCLCMAALASQLDSLLKAALSILGIMGGPLLSMFIIGMTCRHINSKGMLAGFLSSFIIVMFVGYGNLIYQIQNNTEIQYPKYLDDRCLRNQTIFNVTTDSGLYITNTTTATPKVDIYTGFAYIFKLSYMWYSGLSILVSFIVSSLVSCFFKDEKLTNERMLLPFLRYASKDAASKDMFTENNTLNLNAIAC